MLSKPSSFPKAYPWNCPDFIILRPFGEASMQSISQWSMDFGMKTQVLSGKGNLSLTVSDVFKTNKWGGQVLFGALDMNINGGWDSRRLRLNFSYLFGNNQVKKARNRKTGLDEEKKRT